MLKYLRSLFERAKPDGLIDWGETIAASAVAAFLIWRAFGRNNALEELKTSALYLTASVVVGAAFLAFKLVRAASALDNERVERMAVLTSERDALNVRVEELQRKRQHAELVRKQLAKFLFEAEDLERRALSGMSAEHIEGESTTFYNKVARLLDSEMGDDYMARFKAATSSLELPGYAVQIRTLVNRISGRKQVLSKFLEELRNH